MNEIVIDGVIYLFPRAVNHLERYTAKETT